MAVLGDQLLTMAKAAEGRGEVDVAIAHYLKAGLPEEAARLLVANARFSEAAKQFMRAAGGLPEGLEKNQKERRRLFRNAAVCLARGGESRRSAELLMRLGEPLKAAEVLERAGDIAGAAHLRAGGKTLAASTAGGGGASAAQRNETGTRLEKEGRLELALEAFLAARMPADAGRVAHKLKRFADAARLFEDAAMFLQAARCWADAGDTPRSLQNLVRVPTEHKHYRACCIRAIALATELGRLGMELDQFLARFSAGAPQDAAELEAFAQLGRLYETQGFPDSAQDVYRKLLGVQPEHPAKLRLRELEANQQGSNMAYAAILREDADFMRKRAAPQPAAEKSAPAQVAAAPAAAQWPSLPPLRELHADQLQIGQLVAQRYRLEAKIGEGGMATIFRALDTELDEQVAIKVFNVALQDPSLIARFKQELALARKLSHPNIVRLHDIGVDRGCRFISMELLRGDDLSSLLAKRRLPLSEALELLSQACAGLQCAHERGVIHRDVKPENFFVTDEHVLKVMDFGIAKNMAGSGTTRTGFMAGTPHYISPEQIDGFAQVTALTDIYALGVVAYEACTGAPPFVHEELVPLLMMHKNAVPESPKLRNPEIPDSLDRLILRLLAKEPAARVQSCGELRAEFDRIRKCDLPR